MYKHTDNFDLVIMAFVACFAVYLKYALVGAIIGLYLAISSWTTGGCSYPNIAAYTNAGYIASCELLRKRF